MAWLELIGWARRVVSRYAAAEKRNYFLRVQLRRVSEGGGYRKSRFLHAMWYSGAPIGLPLPLVAPRLKSPAAFLDGIAGAARRSLVARLFVGDLDLGAYSSNWDLSARVLPSRSCAYCFMRYGSPHYKEDEWHVFCVCPLYDSFRSRLPFRAERILVEGHVLQGEGCTVQNLRALARAVLQSYPNQVAEFLGRSMAARKQFQRQLQ